MLKTLRQKNQNITIRTLDDPAFGKYGYVLEGDYRPIVDYLNRSVSIPAEGNRYTPDDSDFKRHADRLFEPFFGGTALQYGHVAGQNTVMNAVEYHKSSEVNVAARPMVLFLGDVRDIEHEHYHTDWLEAFYIPAGAAIELLSTTLHFSPCKVEEEGFICAVVLPKGTNSDLETQGTSSDLLFKHNKWLLIHPSHEKFAKAGAAVRLEGDPPEIRV